MISKKNIMYGLFLLIILLVICLALYLFISRPNPQNTLSRGSVIIKNHVWVVEKAVTLLEKTRGLSYRQSLGQDSGMLFEFNPAVKQSFWMKGMNFPLDMIWIRNNKIIDISKNAQPLKDLTRPLYFTPLDVVDYVFEINAGQADLYGFQIGDDVLIK